MKRKNIITFILFTFFLTVKVFAGNIENLKWRLNKINSFHMSFINKITDNVGNIMQEGHGDLWFKYPNLFNWHITKPIEITIISDGITLWFYNKLIEQVTAIWLKDVIKDTVDVISLILIAYDQSNDWHKYNIEQNNDNFILTPKINTSFNLKKLLIRVDRHGIIHQFKIIDQDNQQNIYKIQFQKNNNIDMSKFRFRPFKGLSIDDQRIN